MLRGVRIGMHPDDGAPISLETGKFGPFLRHGDTRASLPKVHMQAPFPLPPLL